MLLGNPYTHEIKDTEEWLLDLFEGSISQADYNNLIPQDAVYLNDDVEGWE